MNTPLQFGKAYNITNFRFYDSTDKRSKERALEDAFKAYFQAYEKNAYWFKRGDSYFFLVDDFSRTEALAQGKLVVAPAPPLLRWANFHPANWQQLCRTLYRQFVPYENGDASGQDASRYQIADYRARQEASIPLEHHEAATGYGDTALIDYNSTYKKRMRPLQDEIATQATPAELLLLPNEQYDLMLTE